MNGNNFSGPVVLALVIGLVIGFALGVFWKNMMDPKMDADTNVVSDEISFNEEYTDSVVSRYVEGVDFVTLFIEGEGTLQVEDQTAGTFVNVSSVNMSKDSWVAVREDMPGGFGNILGAKFVPAGTHTDVRVNVLRNTEAGNTYHVVLFEDNGDELFNYTVDGMMVQDGSAILSSFVAQ